MKTSKALPNVNVEALVVECERTLDGFAPTPCEALFQRLQYVSDLIADAGAMPQEPAMIYRRGDGSVGVYPVRAGATIGRHPECNLVIANDLRLGRKHFRVYSSSGTFLVEDLGSKNGTYINDHDQKIERHSLRDGDLILAGDQVFVFLRNEPVAEVATSEF
jgi:hypothetical protein